MFTVAEIARAFDVHRETVRRWIREGKLEARRRGLRDYRVSQAAAIAFSQRTGSDIVNPWPNTGPVVRR